MKKREVEPFVPSAYHLHTSHSDGRLSTSELINLLHKNGVKEFSVTDHDTLSGAKELINIDFKGMKFVPGIEFTARIMDDVKYINHDFPIHILGYGIDIHNKELNDIVNDIIEFPEANRIYYQELVSDLSSKISVLNFKDITPARKYYDDSDIINAISNLVDCSLDEAERIFHEYDSKIRYKALSASDCIRVIQNAGGVAILAHPYKYTRMRRRNDLTSDELYRLLDDLQKYNLDGVEVFYEGHSDEEISILQDYAVKNKLMVYGGADFHKLGDPLICEKWDGFLKGDL